jgi:hypothetical protein
MIKTVNGTHLQQGMVDTIYFIDPSLDQSRFMVSLITTYGPTDNIFSPEQAVAAALASTQDMAQSEETTWFVFDRQTGEGQFIQQGDVEHLKQEMLR